MSLSQASIDIILQYLDPYLETLQTGFPNSTRPNEPALTITQKRQKIEATLDKDPSIFLTKWGSVLLYPRPASSVDGSNEAKKDGEAILEPKGNSLSAKDVLDLFIPLASNYDIRYQLTKLYQQLQQLLEHEAFKKNPSASTFTPAMTSNEMEIEQSEDLSKEEQKPEHDQNDLFSRSFVSQSTRRNRRLNYLLRYLAPLSPSDSVAMTSNSGNIGSHTTSRSGASDGVGRDKSNGSIRGQDSNQHPILASILSISGSMSNLSFSDSTYFSDAEMEARAPDLYQHYIGRFMDNDDGDDGDSSDTVESGDDRVGNSTGESKADDADDEGDGYRERRRQKVTLKPFGKDVSLIDRILWGVDHPKRNQQAQERGDQGQQLSHKGTYKPSSQQQSQHVSSSNPPNIVPTHPAAGPENQDSESEFEEEFDTESEVEDTEMDDKTDKFLHSTGGSPKNQINNSGGVGSKASLKPPTPPDPIPGVVSSAFASAMAMEESEERTMFASVSNGGNLDSDEDQELDRATATRKEDQQALRTEFVLIMKQRFLDGLDRNFDYSLVDFDEKLDDLEQENNDGEDRWFDSEEDADDVGGPVAPLSGQEKRVREAVSSKIDFDERVKAWENGAQNGSGEYDY
ncbi:hypothetical protein BGZ46_009392 [Entomortierella lignicola]|nr:hypothetical protein BGZ46_009392 [Entomortierella lignicola]